MSSAPVFSRSTAHVFVPDGKPVAEALSRTTHLGVGAHQDDLEFMAFHGILQCFHHVESRWFTGVTCTDGAGSPRTGGYASYTGEQMKQVRVEEQNAAAVIGRYAAMAHLDHPSSVVKNASDLTLRDDLLAILRAAKPQVVYTHNLADKHDTHIAVVVPLLQAIRQLPVSERPAKVYGCEVWRGLDWMDDADKSVLDVAGADNLASALNGVFDSQIAGGKRYDLAVMGRRLANATFYDSHATDQVQQATYAMDLTPLAHDDNLDILSFVLGHIRKFENDVAAKVARRLGQVI
jgi:LmbE family N-acetylglucosaminyl deacetylase